MASTKEIRTKIKSVQNTRKITKAMEMVAASKMRKSQERMRKTRPYSEKLIDVACRINMANTDYKHPFLEERPDIKNVAFIVITTDKGLCGALNSNLLRQLIGKIREHDAKGHGIQAVAIGNKGLGFLQRAGINVKASVTHLGDAPSLEKIIGPVRVLCEGFINGEIDKIYLCHSNFINTMKQEAHILDLLPMPEMPFGSNKHSWDYIYEPSPKVLIDEVMKRFIEMTIFHSLAENIACEQSARMVAMKAASDNANTMIGELQLIYNKTRQAAITKELAEIVGGAAAV